MLAALGFAFIDSINLLLIGVLVAVGIVARRFGVTAVLLIAGDWLGVASLAFLMLVVFDGLGDVVHRFVEGPVFGILLILSLIHI